MLTPVTGVEGLSRRRASSGPFPRVAAAARHTGATRAGGDDPSVAKRAIDASLIAYRMRTDIALSKWLVGICAAAGGVLLLNSPSLGWAVTSRALLLVVVALAYWGINWYLAVTGYTATRPWTAWLSGALEPTFVTACLVMLSVTKGPAWAITSPTHLMYAGLIGVSLCRMRPWLCVYVGAIGSAQYLLIYYVLLGPSIDPAMADVVQPLQPWAAWQSAFCIMSVAAVLEFATRRMRSLASEGSSETWRRRKLETEFGRFVSPDVMNAIMRGDAGVGAAERREVTVLFCDLRDFTGLCEKQAPEDVVALLNEFFEQACAIVRRHGGTVNKFLGDGMLALFGAPDEHPNHAQAAAEAAHGILYAVEQLREQGGVWRYLDIGIGLDSGHVVCGAVGAQSRLEYTAIGSIVNRAARLQGITKQAHRRIVLSRSCVEHLGPRANVISFGHVKLKGFAEPVPVYAFRHS